MSRSPLFGPFLKIQRAKQHLAYLADIERQFFQSAQSKLIEKVDPATGNREVRVILDAEVPEEIHILCGEVIYQIRSALDQLAVSLARLSNGPVKLKDIYFPTGNSDLDFQRQLNEKTKGIDPDLVLQITLAKPFDGGNDVLRSVFPLANVDKHLELIPTHAGGFIDGMSHFELSDFVGTGITIDGKLQSLYDGVLITTLSPTGHFKPRNAQARLQINGQITFGDISPVQFEPVVQCLAKRIDAVEKVVRDIDGYCQETNRIA